MVDRKTKKLLGLFEKLNSLCEEKLDIFFEERKFLEDKTIQDLIIEELPERSDENEFQIKKILVEINKTMGQKIPKEAQKPIQNSFFPMAN